MGRVLRIPQSVKMIGNTAFGCTREVYIESGEFGLEIGSSAFGAVCSSIFVLPKNLISFSGIILSGSEPIEVYYPFNYAPSSSIITGSIPANSILHVPIGRKEDFENSSYWNVFSEIIDDIDMVDDQSLISSFSFKQKSAIISTNSVTSLPIAIDNKNEISAIEFDIVLPQNIELQGDNTISGFERGADMEFSATANEDGSVHVMATSLSALPVGKGDFASITVKAIKSDSYAITLRNVKVTTTNSRIKLLDDEELQFVANHKKGDYNEDGRVDVMDVSNIIDLILDN